MHRSTWVVAAFIAVLVTFAPWTARGENDRRQVLEAELLLTFAEHLGRSPLVGVGAGLEFGAGRAVGLLVGGFALIATPKALTFQEETGIGGGLNVAIRLHLRSNWPRGFGIGIAGSLAVVEGVAVANPRAELYYRFVLADHLALRIIAAGGAMFLWDTQPDDGRPGPGWWEDAVGNSVTGASITIGAAIGWSGARPPSRYEEEGDILE